MKKAFNFRSVLVCVLVLIMCLTAFVACDKKQDLSGLENAKSQIYQTYKKLDNTTQASDFYLFKTIVVGEKTYNIDWSYKVLEGPEENVSLVLDSDKANFVKFAINGQASAETKFVINGYVKDEKGNKLVIAENGFTIKVPKFATATYAEFVAMCKENGSSINASSKTCAVLAYIVGVNCNGSSMGSVWAMDKDGNGYYVYSPKYPEGFTKTREALNEYLPIGTEVVIHGTPTLQFGATLQFNKNATIEKTGNTAADKNVTLDYIDATDAWSKATDIQDTALEGFQARRVELKGITMGRKEGNDWYFTVGGVEFICRSNIYLMTEADQKALEEKWVVGGKANLKGLVNVYSKKYQVYPDSVNALEVLTQTDEEAVAGVKASLALEATYEDNFTLPTSDAAVVTWAIKSGTGAVIGENNLVTITRANADQKVVFTATIKKGEVIDTKEFEITIPAIVVEDPNTVVLTTKSLKLENGKYQESPADGVTVNGVTFAFKEIGYYDADIQTRNKNNKASAIWNTTAFNKPIKEIRIKLSAGKAGFSNNNTHSFKFGNAVNGAENIQQLSTVKDQYEYVITPDAATYTFFTFEQNESYTYSSYFESITIVYAEEKSDAKKVEEAKAALTLDVTSTGVSFKLPLVGENGATISWKSSNTDVIAINGEDAVVTAPAADTLVKLTATIKIGEATDTKTFDVTVTPTIPEFDVTITQPAAGGTVEVKNGADVIATGKVQQGTVLTITATPQDDKHELVAIKVNGKAIEAVDGVYSVKVTEAVEITAEFKEIKNVTVTIAAVENGKVEVKKGADVVANNAVLRDGDVLTITATANAGYKVSAIKVNGEAIKGNTYTITGAEADGKVAITVETAEIPAMTIAEFKASAKGTQARVTGIVTNIDSKATWIQDADGNALYVYATGLKDVAVGKQVTLVGSKDEYKGLLQLKNVQVIKVEDTATVITATVLDEAGYKALVANDAGKLVSINGLVYVSGTATTDKGGSLTFKLGNTDVTVRVEKGEAAALNTAVLSKLQAGNVINLKNVNFGWFNNAQIAVSQVEQIEVVWNVSAEIDKSEIVIGGTAKITAAINPNFMAATVGDITFESDNKDAATVDANGVVTGVAAGNAIITVKAGDKTTTVNIKVVATATEYTVNYSAGENGTITVKAGETDVKTGDKVVADTKLTVTVAPAEGFRLASVTVNGTADTSVAGKTSFELTITADTTFAVAFEEIPATKTLQKATSIAVGDQIVLAYESGEKKYEIGTYATKGFFNCVAYTDVPAQVQLLTVVAGTAEGQFAFKTASGKYLTLTKDDNKLYESELSAVNDAASWTVTFDANGNIVITSVKYTTRSIRFNANSGQERFATYKGTQQSIIAYKLV